MISITFSASIFKCFGTSRFLDFGSHYRRPRGPTGDLRVAIFAPKGLQKGMPPKYGEALRSVRVTVLSPLSVARATLHVQRRTCNVQRRIFDVFFSFLIDFSSHWGFIFVYFWHVFASIFPISFSHCFVQRCIFDGFVSLFALLFILLSSILTYHKPDN